MFKTAFLLIGAILLTSGTGCALLKPEPTRSYKTVVAGPQRDTEEARKCNEKAIRRLADGDIASAREQADKALIANVDFAPAHNTLGKILFRQKNYYLAAWEYQFAIQLQPKTPEYHNNLGLVYEAAGRLNEAELEFQTAVDFEPESYHFVSNLARAKVRQGEVSPETAILLKDVVFRDPRKEWKDWAGELLKTTHLDQPAMCLDCLPDSESSIDHVTTWGNLEEVEPPDTLGLPIPSPTVPDADGPF